MLFFIWRQLLRYDWLIPTWLASAKSVMTHAAFVSILPGLQSAVDFRFWKGDFVQLIDDIKSHDHKKSLNVGNRKLCKTVSCV